MRCKFHLIFQTVFQNNVLFSHQFTVAFLPNTEIPVFKEWNSPVMRSISQVLSCHKCELRDSNTNYYINDNKCDIARDFCGWMITKKIVRPQKHSILSQIFTVWAYFIVVKLGTVAKIPVNWTDNQYCWTFKRIAQTISWHERGIR